MSEFQYPYPIEFKKSICLLGDGERVENSIFFGPVHPRTGTADDPDTREIDFSSGAHFLI